MEISRLKLKNWRNFRSLDVSLRDTSYILGPNAAGKSNLLDAFRFLRDLSKPKGGGLQEAVAARGGITKVRCLHARRDTEVLIDIEVLDERGSEPVQWRYALGFKPEGKGAQRILISTEQVWRRKLSTSSGQPWLPADRLFERPDAEDKMDPALLTQTRLEQIAANAEFRDLAEFLGEITYLHLVPQLLRFADQIGGRILGDDPFGQGFLERIAKTPAKIREARLRKIGEALTLAVPQFKELTFRRDETTGRPHLEARYQHYRPNAGWQSEAHFSDGTLRLLGLLWSLLDGTSLLLLEEPEISLNDAVVRQIPLIIQRLQRNKKQKRQVIITTHSEALLSNPGIDGGGVIVLEPGNDGSTGRGLQEEESSALVAGLSVAEVVLPKTRPKAVNQLGLW